MNFFYFLFLLFEINILYSQYIEFNTQTQLTVIGEDINNIFLKNSIGKINFEPIEKENNQFFRLKVDNYINYGYKGYPSVPILNKLIEIPYNADIFIEVISYDEEIIKLADRGIRDPLYPYQPSVRKDQTNVPFYYNKESYHVNKFYYDTLVKVKKCGIIRDKEIALLSILPIKYNPVEGILKVYKNITFKIHFNNVNYDTIYKIKQKYNSPIFSDNISRFLFYKLPEKKDAITTYPIKYLIISDRMFENTLQPFINWKIKQGYIVHTAYTDQIGNTTGAIKNYIQSQYNNATPDNPAPTYVLFVGDIQQIPSYNGTTGGHVTDLYYLTMNGASDYLPDMYSGRFSATTVQQLQNIIEKTLEYEQFTMPDSSYLQYALMIAGVDATYAPTYGNGQINYGNLYYTNENNGIISYTYLYGSGSPIVSNSPQAAPAIKQNISNGIGFGNYTAHCSSNGWADPSVTTSDIPNLTNNHRYGFLIGNCCLSNKFNDNECFGEALLRAPNKGAIGYIGGSNNTYWDEDYYYSVGVKQVSANPVYDPAHLGFYDRLFHLFGEEEFKWFITASQINYAGNLAVEESGSPSNRYYWEIYHLMGDPSLMPYLGIPSLLSAQYPTSVPIGTPYIQIQTEPYAYVGLSLNNSWIAAGYSGSQGIVNLNISSVVMPCTLDIVITKQNRIPHFGNVILVPSNTPFVIQHNYTFYDYGVLSNSIADYSEIIYLNPIFKNLGQETAYNLSAKLKTNNVYVELIDSTVIIGNLGPQQVVQIDSAFAFKIDTLIPDLTPVHFTVIVQDSNENTWITNFVLHLNAPIIKIMDYYIDDSQYGNNNGRLDPGETVYLNIEIANAGHSLSSNGVGILTSNSPYVFINNYVTSINQILPSSSTLAQYELNISVSTPIGSYVPFNFVVDANGYGDIRTFNLPVGLIIEDFETGNFNSYNWDTVNYGDAPWIIISGNNIFEGNYSARSGYISHGTYWQNSKSDLHILITTTSSDTLSFYRRVSSELNYDFLQFIVDGNIIYQWSGEIPWARVTYYLLQGTHNIIWRYTKDFSESAGEDAGFIDYITFPPLLSSSTSEEKPVSYIIVYPIPFDDMLFIKNNISSKWIYVNLYNTLGQKIYEKKFEGNTNIALDLSNINSGTYVLKIDIGNKEYNYRIIKLKK
ncbi:MAG: C25 family cysteine peptidase [Bacteroidales bacterium]|nr:C25 family cysteine peptidase [Bacteroidales bacterium]